MALATPYAMNENEIIIINVTEICQQSSMDSSISETKTIHRTTAPRKICAYYIRAPIAPIVSLAESKK